MSGKILKAAIFTLIVVMLLSTVFPGGVASGTNPRPQANLLFGLDYEEEYDDPNNVFEFKSKEPSFSVRVEGENGKCIIIEVPWGSEKEEIEDMINDELEGESPEEDPPEIEEKEDVVHENHLRKVNLMNNYAKGYLEGYLFCKINESLYFDASYLAIGYENVVYEWDIGHDGTYEHVSTSPTISHFFSESGIYTLKIKITYAFNYSYYPIFRCGNELSYKKAFDTTSINLPVINVNEGGSYEESHSFIGSVERKNIYEIKISVGSEKSGYPPILDFVLSGDGQELGPRNGISFPIKVPDITPRWYEPVKYLIQIPLSYNSSVAPQVFSNISFVQVKGDRSQYDNVQEFDEGVINIDASNTRDNNGDLDLIWDFGDGEFGEGWETGHTYSHKGTYTVTLRAEKWDVILSKTIKIRRGYDDPKLVVIGYDYRYPNNEFLFCTVNDPMTFDLEQILRGLDVKWIEWDFDSDEIYEENRTDKMIVKSFSEPGYLEVGFRYTYTYTYYDYGNADRREGPKPHMERFGYVSQSLIIKVVVRNEDNEYPIIPDFRINAPTSFTWWDQNTLRNEIEKAGLQENITYIKYNYNWQKRLNTWRNPVTFNANTTIIPKGTSFDDFEFLWDFGDGTNGTGLIIEHEFLRANIDYNVTLTVKSVKSKVSILKVTKPFTPRPYSPNIYLYREKPEFDIIKVIVDGRVTKAIPNVPLGSKIVWDNVLVAEGKLFYKNKEYDFLYYEELLNEPKTSKYGWILERDEKGRLFLNDKLTTLEKLKDHFRGEMRKAGLFNNEIEDFIHEWLGEGARLFPGKQAFRYVIRFHLLVQPAEKGAKLLPPKYKEHERRVNRLHEWGVYSGNSILRNKEMEFPDTAFDNLFFGNMEYQSTWSQSVSLGDEDLTPYDQLSLPFQAQEKRYPLGPSGCSRCTPHNPSSQLAVHHILPWPSEDPPP
jgi:PKD repeat protein